MVIYQFSKWGKEIKVEGIEVKETNKTFIGKRHRFRKDELNTLTRYGDMFSLENDKSKYVELLVNKRKNRVSMLKGEIQSLESEVENLMKEV